MARPGTSLRLLVATAVLSLLPLSGLWLWKGQGPLGAPATVLVKRGATVDAMAEELEREGVIRSATLFKLWARARRLQLLRGEYTFDPRASLSDVANKLKRGDIHYTSITVPPGAHACRFNGTKCLTCMAVCSCLVGNCRITCHSTGIIRLCMTF